MTYSNTFVSGRIVSTLCHGLARQGARRLSSRLALAAAVMGAGALAHAASLTWDPSGGVTTPSGGTGNWDLTTLDWSNGATDVAWTDTTTAGTDTAIFSGTSGTVTLTANLSALGLQFLTSNYTIAGIGNLTLGASGMDLSNLSGGTTTLGANVTLAANQTWNTGTGSTLAMNGIVSGTLNLTKAGGGTLALNNADTWTGALAVTGGKLLLTNIAALQSTQTVTVSSGTIVELATDGGDNAFTVAMGTGTATTIASDVKTGGVGINHTINANIGGGTFSIVAGANVTSGTASLTLANLGLTSGTGGATTFINPTTAVATIGNISISSTANAKNVALDGTNSGNTVTGTISNGISGANLSLIKSGSSTWTITGTGTYSGSTTLNGGLLQFISNGTNTMATGAYAFSAGNYLYQGSSAANSTQTMGAITGAGNGVFTIAFGGSNLATVTAASFAHSAGNSAILVNGTNLGKDATGTGSESRLIITAAPALVGGTPALNTGINAASQNTQIVPFLLGEAATASGGAGTATGVANTFVTYVAGSGLRPLNPSDEFSNAILTGNNIYITSATSAASSTAINSLVINGGDVSIADGAVLTDSSGALLFVSSNSIKPSGTTGSLLFGSEGIVTVNAGITGTIAAPISGSTALTKGGLGTLVLSGTDTSPGLITVTQGNLTLTGAIADSATTGSITVNAPLGNTATMNVNGGTVTIGAANFLVGNSAGGTSILNINGGNITTGGSNGTQRNIQLGVNGMGVVNMTGGNVTIGGFFIAGITTSGASGIWNITGGNLTINPTAAFNFGGTIGATAGTNGVVNMSNGTFNSQTTGSAGGVFLGEAGTGTINLSGTAVMNLGGASTSAGLTVGGNTGTTTGGVGNFNLGAVGSGGGLVSTNNVRKSTSSSRGTFNFHGGTLQAATGIANSANFFTGLTGAFVYGEGGTIDNNNQTITIAQPLLAPTGLGVKTLSTAGLQTQGYTTAPLVVISGGTGVGATAVANVNAASVLTGITLTNPGTGYLSNDTLTVTLSGGGYATSSASTTAATLGTNISGGLTFTGIGTTNLTGINTYTGQTKVIGGDLLLSGTGTINNSNGILINGAGAKFTQATTTALTPVVTVTNGTLEGNGTVNSAIVTNGTGGIISNGVSGNGTLTVGNLTFNGAGTINLLLNSTSPVLNTTNLTTSGGSGVSTGKITVNVSNTTLPWTSGTYQLISYTTLGGVGFNDFVKGNITGLGGRQSANLTNAGGVIDLVVAGDNPKWTGALNGSWTTATLASPKNWTLISGGTATDYIQGDVVLFDDSATGTTDVNISDATVSPTSTTFNNNGRAYTVSSTGGFGIGGSGSVNITGFGAVSLNTQNTYSGGTNLSNGTLNINSASAIGTGRLTINSGTIDNTSAAPVTLSTNNPQTWNAAVTFGGTKDLNLGTGAVTLNATPVVTTNNSANLTVGGNITGAFGLTKQGTGTLILSGTNTYSGSTIISNGTLAVAGGVTGTLTTGANSDIQISPGTSDNGTLLVTGGVVNADRVIVGGDTANDAGGNAHVIQSGGTINSQQWFTVGSGNTVDASFPVGEYDISAGTLNVFSQALEIANFQATTGTVNISGGNINLFSNTPINMGANGLAGDGTVNQSGGNVTFYSDAGVTVGGTGILSMGRAATAAGVYTYNLNGGTLTVPGIATTTGTNGTSVFNFNGGVLRAAKASTTFMTGLSQANVDAGGAIIDDNGFAITIGQALGSGASPDGGLTKLGAGTLTLTGSSTYNGPTTITRGTLLLSGTGSVNGSSGINVNGGKLVQISTTAVSPTVTISNGTLTGSNATLNSVVVNSSATNLIANGNNDTGILTIGSLTFNGNAVANITLAGPSANAAPGIATTNLTTSGGSTTSTGHVTINAVNSLWNVGTYDLIGYSSIAGVGFNDFQLGNVAGLTPRQSASLSNITGEIALLISGGNIPVWSGALNGNWTTATLANPKNWRLQTGGAATDFIAGDTVIFDDTATGTTNVNISDASVAPTSTTFNNNSLNYTISSTGGFGISSGFVVKNGTGAVTLATANSYAGGTTLNAGTLNVNNAAALGTGPVTVTGGVFGNTSGSPVVSTTTGALTISGDFAFNGPSSLTLGTGAVTLSGSGTSRTINVTSSDLAIGPIQSAATFGLTKTGSGTLTITASANDNNAARVSTIGGDLNIVAGTFQIGGNDFHAGGLIGSGTIEDGSTTTRWLFVNNTTNETFSGILQDGSGGGRLGLNKSGGNGTLTLTGNNSYSDATNVGTGTLVFSGTTNNTTAIDNIGTVGGTNGVLVIGAGSTFNANDNPGQFTSSLAIGGNATAAGDVRLGFANSSLSVGAQFGLGTGTGGYAAYTQTAGTANIASFVVVGFNNDRSVLNMSGGNLTIATNLMTVAAGGTGAVGVATISGGNFTAVATTGNAGTIGGIYAGEFGNGTVNVSGTANVTLAGRGLVLGVNAGAFGTVNLDGGTVNTNSIAQGAGTGALNLNGATIKATGASATFLQGIASATIYGGGVTIDDGGFAVTIGQALLGATGSGLSNTGITATGTGFIDTPIVQVSGDGTGATAVASVDSNGNLTGITITNPGQNYTNASFSLIGGGVTSSGSVSSTTAVVANTPGALNKNGTGTLTLSGASTYSGATNVNAGSLVLAATGSLASNAMNVAANSALTVTAGGTIPATVAVTNNGSVNLNNPTHTFATLNGTNSAAVVNLNTTNLTVSSGGAYAGAINDGGTGGALTVAAALSVGSFNVGTVNANANLQIHGTSKTSALNLTGGTGAWTSGLDLTTSKFILESTVSTKTADLARITDQAQFGKTHADGIFTSSGLGANFGMAVVDNGIVNKTTFGGVSVDPNSILVGAEVLGDANIDGHVDLTDLSTVLNNFGSSTTAWTSGNFDGAGTIDLTDLSDVLNNFGATNPNASDAPAAGIGTAIVATPEPASLAVMSMGLAVLLRRSRRSA